MSKGNWIIYQNIESGRYHGHVPYGSKPELYRELKAKDVSFKALLKFESCYENYHRFKDVRTGEFHLILDSAFGDLMSRATISEGFVRGKWGFLKNGRTISIELLEELENEDE